MRPVNLLPENLRPRVRKAGASGGAYVVLGVLGLLLAGVVSYVITANQVTSRKAETEQLRVETYAAEQRAGALAQFGAFKEMKETRVASVAMLAAGRFDWERMSRELARVLPTGVWVTELDATATGEQVSSSGGASSSSSTSSSSTSSSSTSGSAGAAGTAGAGAGAQGPSLKLLGCAPSQEGVAETMVRLRRLHQAQEVELLNSEREQEASGSAGSAAPQAPATPGTSSPAASSGGAPQGCGTKRGRPNYQFEVRVTLTPTPDPTLDGGSVPRSLGGGA